MGGTLVIQSRPWLESFVGVLFLAGGTWALVSGEPVFGGGFVIAAVILLVAFANIVTSTFDKTSGRFTRSTRGLVRRNSVTHPLNDIMGVKLESTNSSGSPSKGYRVVLVLRSGKRVPIASGYTSGKAAKQRQAVEILRFLNLPDTAEPAMPGFRDVMNMMR